MPSAAEVNRNIYENKGFLHIPKVLPDEAFAPLHQRLSQAVQQHAEDLYAQKKITELHEELPLERRFAVLYENRRCDLRGWDEMLYGPEFFSIASHPKVLDCLEDLLGPNINFNSDFHLRPKLPGSALTSFPWHQDSQYYGKPTSKMHIVTVWIPLVDVDEKNGCLWLIPGSHQWGLLDGARGEDQNIRTFEDVEARGTPVAVPMKRGDILLFSNLTFHASQVNQTQDVRWSLDLRYSRTPKETGMAREEADAYAYYYGRLQKMNRIPVPVRGDGVLSSCESWLACCNAASA